MMYGFWITVIAYSVVMLILVYTYQFHNFPSYWEYLHIDKDLYVSFYELYPSKSILFIIFRHFCCVGKWILVWRLMRRRICLFVSWHLPSSSSSPSSRFITFMKIFWRSRTSRKSGKLHKMERILNSSMNFFVGRISRHKTFIKKRGSGSTSSTWNDYFYKKWVLSKIERISWKRNFRSMILEN